MKFGGSIFSLQVGRWGLSLSFESFGRILVIACWLIVFVIGVDVGVGLFESVWFWYWRGVCMRSVACLFICSIMHDLAYR